MSKIDSASTVKVTWWRKLLGYKKSWFTGNSSVASGGSVKEKQHKQDDTKDTKSQIAINERLPIALIRDAMKSGKTMSLALVIGGRGIAYSTLIEDLEDYSFVQTNFNREIIKGLLTINTVVKSEALEHLKYLATGLPSAYSHCNNATKQQEVYRAANFIIAEILKQ